MPHEAPAYLLDIVEACDAITSAISSLELDAYRGNRLVRSSVEREFIIIGEAVAALGAHAPALFARIPQARRVVDFRNQLTHGYRTLNDTIVWGIARRDVPMLRRECAALLSQLERPGAK